MNKEYDILGIGNAIVDFLMEVTPEQLNEMKLTKGQFHLVEEDVFKRVMSLLDETKMKVVPGGSCANTIVGTAGMGAKAAFIGKVGNDKYGDLYETTMRNDLVSPILSRAEMITGSAICLVTPDAERTFVVHLGAATSMDEMEPSLDEIKKAKILHVEGYMLDSVALRLVALKAMKIAKENGVKISIDLADPGVVKRNLLEIRKIVKDYGDIVFANEMEAESFTGMNAEKAVHDLADGHGVGIAIVKTGSKGSIIKQNGKITIVEGYKANAVDTTGAGDMYAAGVLYGISQGWELDKSGRLGSYLASKIVEQMGARAEFSLKDEISKM